MFVQGLLGSRHLLLRLLLRWLCQVQVIYPLSIADAVVKEGLGSEVTDSSRQALDQRLDELMEAVRLSYLVRREGGWGVTLEWGETLSLGMFMCLPTPVKVQTKGCKMLFWSAYIVRGSGYACNVHFICSASPSLSTAFSNTTVSTFRDSDSRKLFCVKHAAFLDISAMSVLDACLSLLR